jgi:hypothetical protein
MAKKKKVAKKSKKTTDSTSKKVGTKKAATKKTAKAAKKAASKKSTPKKATKKATSRATNSKKRGAKKASVKAVSKAPQKTGPKKGSPKATKKSKLEAAEPKKKKSKSTVDVQAGETSEVNAASVSTKQSLKKVKGRKKKEEVTTKSKPKAKDHDPDEIPEVDEDYSEEEVGPEENLKLSAEEIEELEDVVLTDAEGRRLCKVKDCDELATVEKFCRYHYLLYWKKIQTRKKILADGKLDKYIEELTSRYPDKYIEMLRKDLKSEKDFISAIQELEIDDASEADFEEDDDNLMEEVRGMGGTGQRGSREDEDF